ncbi:MAG TPA: hypothetical protein VFD48_05010, partial [Pyrinomonadaceae bacterium]|nr:hypothetical protein [Pyrinomonadaceae bacterium]
MSKPLHSTWWMVCLLLLVSLPLLGLSVFAQRRTTRIVQTTDPKAILAKADLYFKNNDITD